ncbi:MAG: hypothetical protein ABSD75_00740 [Terriglobales bacterium]|jgi:hypothetical protein
MVEAPAHSDRADKAGVRKRRWDLPHRARLVDHQSALAAEFDALASRVGGLGSCSRRPLRLNGSIEPAFCTDRQESYQVKPCWRQL